MNTSSHGGQDTDRKDVTTRLPFEEPRLVRDEAWTLENVTANLGGFMSGPSGGRDSKLRHPGTVPLR